MLKGNCRKGRLLRSRKYVLQRIKGRRKRPGESLLKRSTQTREGGLTTAKPPRGSPSESARKKKAKPLQETPQPNSLTQIQRKNKPSLARKEHGA